MWQIIGQIFTVNRGYLSLRVTLNKCVKLITEIWPKETGNIALLYGEKSI